MVRMVVGIDQLRHFETCASGVANRRSPALCSALPFYWQLHIVHTKSSMHVREI